MRSPSIKALVATFGIEREQARGIKVICDATCAGSSRASAEALHEALAKHAPSVASDYHTWELHSRMRRREAALAAADAIIGTCGVEALGPCDPWDGYAPAYEYCNAGDPYVATLIYKRATDNLYIGSWGTIAERLPSSDE